MKASLRMATFVATVLLVGLAAFHATAQNGTRSGRPQTPPRQAGGEVAVVDISHIFLNHNRFKAMKEDVTRDVKAIDGQLRQRQKDLVARVEQLKQFKTGSPDYKELEIKIAQQDADLRVQVQLKKKDIMQREAKILANVYAEIQEEVRWFAERHGISLVVNFNRQPINSDSRESVVRGVNRPVVYQNKIDITYEILERLNSTRPRNRSATRRNNDIPRPR